MNTPHLQCEQRGNEKFEWLVQVDALRFTFSRRIDLLRSGHMDVRILHSDQFEQRYRFSPVF